MEMEEISLTISFFGYIHRNKVIALYSCALRHLAKHSVDGQSASDARADT